MSKLRTWHPYGGGSQGAPAFFRFRLDKQAPGPLDVGQQFGRRVEDDNVEESIRRQSLRNGFGNQVEGRTNRPHRRRHQPYEEHHSPTLSLFWNLDIDEVGKSQVGAGFKAVAKDVLHLFSKRLPRSSNTELRIRRHHPEIINQPSKVSPVMDAIEESGYGLVVKILIGILTLLLATLPSGGSTADDFEAVLERAREAALQHRYNEVIELLTPFNANDEPEIRYITAAEIGRAYFHLGRYREAHRAFREAVRLHPERAETAMYLEATAYLVGEPEQAYAILSEILKSGARDLYLAVTLPGERRFLADPRVHEIIEEFFRRSRDRYRAGTCSRCQPGRQPERRGRQTRCTII